MSQENRDRNEPREIPTGILSPLTIARYRRDLTYRKSREQKHGDRLGDTVLGQSVLYVAWGITIVLGVLLVWRFLAYTIPAAKVAALAIFGDRAQGTVLKKKTEQTGLGSPRYVVTYGYWVQGKGIIGKTSVPEKVFTPLVVDDEVIVIYYPGRPEWSVVRGAMSLHWPVDVLIMGGGFALACTGLNRLRGLATWEGQDPDASAQETDAGDEDQPKRTPVGTA
jgi:hypothetical protein